MAAFTELTRRLMADRGVSVRGLAKIVAYDQGGLSRIINGKRSCPPYLARAIDDALNAGGQVRMAAAAVAVPLPDTESGLSPMGKLGGGPRRQGLGPGGPHGRLSGEPGLASVPAIA
jgi:hypothetical protein